MTCIIPTKQTFITREVAERLLKIQDPGAGYPLYRVQPPRVNAVATLQSGIRIGVTPLLIYALSQASPVGLPTCRYWISEKGELLIVDDSSISPLTQLHALTVQNEIYLNIAPGRLIQTDYIFFSSINKMVTDIQGQDDGQVFHVQGGANGQQYVVETSTGFNLITPNAFSLFTWHARNPVRTALDMRRYSIVADLDKNDFLLWSQDYSSSGIKFQPEMSVGEATISARFSLLGESPVQPSQCHFISADSWGLQKMFSPRNAVMHSLAKRNVRSYEMILPVIDYLSSRTKTDPHSIFNHEGLKLHFQAVHQLMQFLQTFSCRKLNDETADKLLYLSIIPSLIQDCIELLNPDSIEKFYKYRTAP